MRRFLPRTRMGLFAAVVVCLWVAKTLLFVAGARRLVPVGLQALLDLLTLLLVVPALYYSWRLFGVVRRRLLWRLRRRLILAHVFIGAIPVLLVIIIIWVAILLFYYQFSYYLVENQIGIHSAQIHAFNLSLRAALQAELAQDGGVNGLKAVLDRDSPYLLGEYPSAHVVIRAEDSTAGRAAVFGNINVNASRLGRYQVPRWASGREFSGLILEDSEPGLYDPGDGNSGGRGRRRLFLRSLVFSEGRSDLPFSVEVSVPLDGYMLGRLKAAMGQDLMLADHVPVAGLSVMLQSTNELLDDAVSATFDLDQPESPGRSVWSILLFPTSWNSGMEMASGDSQVLFIELSTSKLMQNVFRSESNVSRTIVGVLQIVLIFFLFVELTSLVIGIALTKSITSAVYNLYRGTEFVKRGDFSHRIVVKSQDQLGALAASFNQMTEYVQALVKERVQKERLERELEIAREVQEQLFPREAPQMEHMELTGLCLPARVVSGDYYDFLKFSGDRMGLAVGDICGKGISAALLMANLQAALRSNVIEFFKEKAPGAPTPDGAVASVVKTLNDQICSYTSANKYSTFFYAVYDDRLPALTYCNAGHNPPLCFNGDGFRRLMTGGTVVGIFPDAEYEQETVQLANGDLLVAYTDGIVESVNEYGEEFGEERLIQLILANRGRSAEDIKKAVVDNVVSWSYEEERDDDMTLVVAKIH